MVCNWDSQFGLMNYSVIYSFLNSIYWKMQNFGILSVKKFWIHPAWNQFVIIPLFLRSSSSSAAAVVFHPLILQSLFSVTAGQKRQAPPHGHPAAKKIKNDSDSDDDSSSSDDDSDDSDSNDEESGAVAAPPPLQVKQEVKVPQQPQGRGKMFTRGYTLLNQPRNFIHLDILNQPRNFRHLDIESAP